MENLIKEVQLPTEVIEIAKNVSIEKRNDVKNVLNSVFNGVAKMREQLDNIEVVDEKDKVNMQLANTIRLGVKRVRLDAEKTFDAKRQELQQAMLSYKTEDSLWLKAKQTMQILTKEIEETAKWKEETAKRYEEEKKELKKQQRIAKISQIAPEISSFEFENMTDETFESFYLALKKSYEEKIESEKKAEEERLAKLKAEAEERKRIETENLKLKAEAEKKAKELEIERKKQAEKEAKLKAEADAREKAIEENAKKEREKQEAKLKEEMEEKAKIEAELKARKEKELAEKEAKELAEKKAKNAPDKEKLIAFANKIENLELPEIKGSDGLEIIKNIKILLTKTANFAREKSQNL